MSTATTPAPRPRPAKRKGPNPITVVTGTLGLFLVVQAAEVHGLARLLRDSVGSSGDGFLALLRIAGVGGGLLAMLDTQANYQANYAPFFGLVWLVVVVTVGVVWFANTTRNADAQHAGMDQPAPDIIGTSLDGQPFRLADLHGRPVILNFWGPSCVPCRSEFPLLEAKQTQLAGDGLQIVGILTDDPPAPARDFVAEFGATWPTVTDPGDALPRHIASSRRRRPTMSGTSTARASSRSLGRSREPDRRSRRVRSLPRRTGSPPVVVVPATLPAPLEGAHGAGNARCPVPRSEDVV